MSICTIEENIIFVSARLYEFRYNREQQFNQRAINNMYELKYNREEQYN